MIVAIDGNSTGKIIEKYILLEDRNKLNNFSAGLTIFIHKIGKIIEDCGGSVIMCGGDNIIAEIDESLQTKICQVIDKNNNTDINFTIVFSGTMQEAYVGLKYAKSIGQNFLRVTRDSDGILKFQSQ